MTSKWRNIPAIVLSIVFLIVGLWFAQGIQTEMKSYQETKESIINDVLNFENRLLNYKEAIPEIWKDEWEQKKVTAEFLELKSAKHQEKAFENSYYLLLIVATYFVFMLIFYARSRPLWATLFSFQTIVILGIYLGVTLPLMELSAFSEDLVIPLELSKSDVAERLSDWKWVQKAIPEFSWDLSRRYEGRIYYFYQNKSILGVSEHLWNGGEALLTILILTFSVLVPLIKGILVLYMLFTNKKSKWFALEKINGALSKFSMVDVFAIALLLTYLSTQNMSLPIQSEAQSLLGMYWFLGAVLLSILLSLLMKFVVRGKKQKSIELSQPALEE